MKIILNLWKKYRERYNWNWCKLNYRIFFKKIQKLPLYKLISNTGPRHKPIFKVGVKLINTKLYISEGKSKKEAEQNAAILCYNSIK